MASKDNSDDLLDTVQLTPLETAVLGCFHNIYAAKGFPPIEAIRIVKREHTVCGRYVGLLADVAVDLDDGYLDLGGRFIEMPAVPAGIMAVVQVRNRRIVLLEFTTYGGDSWSGEEVGWTIA